MRDFMKEDIVMKKSKRFLGTAFILGAVLLTAPCFASTDADPVTEAEPLTEEAAEAGIS